MTKSRFDIEYNNWLQQVNVDGEDTVWNEIQDELDFIETWDNISGKLDEIKPQKGSMVPIRYLNTRSRCSYYTDYVFASQILF
jgi:hypothetical protein